MHQPIDSLQLRPYERKFTSPRIDIIFKRVFGTERNKSVLVAFLREMTGVKILDLTFENTELGDASELDGKTVRLDVLATVQTAKGPQLVNIEVQNVAEAGLVHRALFYWARAYSSQLKAGMRYRELHPTLVIFVLNEELFADQEHHVTQGLVINPKTGKEIMVNNQRPLELMFIELSKVRKRLDIDPMALKNMNRWLVFLAADSDGVLEELRMQAQDIDLDRALTEIEYAALSKRDQLLYQARMDAIRDHESLLDDRDRRGEARGKAELVLKIAKARFGALSEILEESILSLPLEQLDEVGLLVATCSDAEAFKSALSKSR